MHFVLAISSSVQYLWPAKVEIIDLSDSFPLSHTSLLASSAVSLWNEFLTTGPSDRLSERNDDFFLWQRQRPSLLQNLPGFALLESLVLDHAAAYAGLPVASLRVLAWTAVQSSLGGYHSPHTHTGEAAVAVFYAQMHSDSGGLLFLDPRGHVPPFGRQRVLHPKIGTVVIFPAWLPHSAMPSVSAEPDRVIFAFNVGVVNETGSLFWFSDLSADLELSR
jgi:hypothetical protein